MERSENGAVFMYKILPFFCPERGPTASAFPGIPVFLLFFGSAVCVQQFWHELCFN